MLNSLWDLVSLLRIKVTIYEYNFYCCNKHYRSALCCGNCVSYLQNKPEEITGLIPFHRKKQLQKVRAFLLHCTIFNSCFGVVNT
jgi:hypothetical protein